MATSFFSREDNTDDRNDDRREAEDRGEDSSFEYNGRKMSREDALNKMTNADKHIQTLEEERSRDRERQEAMLKELETLKTKQETFEELYERMGKRKEEPNADENNDRKTVDEDKLAERAADVAYARMTKAEQEREIKRNQDYVTNALSERYGDKTDEKVFSITRDLGYSDEEAFELAGKKPKAFLRLIGFESDKPVTGRPTRSDVQNPTKEEGEQRPSYKDLTESRNTNGRIAAWEKRLEDKMKQLGIQT